MELKITISSIFIVPTLKIDRDKLKENGFVNAYIKDIRRDVQYENAVYLLFKPNRIVLFRQFVEDEYERTKYLIDDYDYEDGFVVLVYKLNEHFKDDFELVKQGKYSKTSNLFQEQFPKIKKIIKNGLHRDEISLQWRIFRKAEDLKEHFEDKLAVELKEDMELWDKFDEEKETLNLDKIKELL